MRQITADGAVVELAEGVRAKPMQVPKGRDIQAGDRVLVEKVDGVYIIVEVYVQPAARSTAVRTGAAASAQYSADQTEEDLPMERTMFLIKAAVAAVGGFLAYWLGGLDQLLIALIAVMVLDYLTGLLAAVHTKTLSSAVGFRGIVKKILLLGIVALAFIIDQVSGGVTPLREMTILFFLANEGISILENAAGAGLPVPERLRQVLEQLKGNGDGDE